MSFIIPPDSRDEALFVAPGPRRQPPRFSLMIRPQDGPIAHPNLASALNAAADLIAGRDYILTVSRNAARGYDTFCVVNVMVRSVRKNDNGRSLPEFCCAIVAGDEPPVQFIDAALTRAGLRAALQTNQVVRTLNTQH